MRKLPLALLLPAISLAQSPPSGGPYLMQKQVIATGGSTASAGSWSVTGTVGQSAVQVAAGGSYQLTGGFHGPTVADGPPDLIFSNGFEN